jgi:hypothetical protein
MPDSIDNDPVEMSAGAIAGITIAVFVFVVVLAFVIYLLVSPPPRDRYGIEMYPEVVYYSPVDGHFPMETTHYPYY